jgi:Ni/Co efflux regulator RcnB
MGKLKSAGALALAAVAVMLSTPPTGHAEGKGHAGPRRAPHGRTAGPARTSYGVGERLPAAYVAAPRHLLADPPRYALRHAPAGFRWVVIDRDAYLVRTRTGEIADAVILIG